MISDDELLLYYYRELEADERARIGAALAEQPELAQRLHRLEARLDAVSATPGTWLMSSPRFSFCPVEGCR